MTSQIVDAVHSVLERTPPELAADIADRGIVLTGGGALLHGLEDLIEENTGITTMTAEEPLTAVAIGTGKYIEFLSERKDRTSQRGKENGCCDKQHGERGHDRLQKGGRYIAVF